jgi:3-oxoacyl-[acyl-carrier protein] reductase
MSKKNILIAGGSKGLGYEIVKEFSNMNNLFVFSRKRRNLNKNINFFSVDLSKEKNTLNAFKALKKKTKKIDLIIFCVGSGKPNSKNELSKKAIMNFFDINFYTFSNLINSYLRLFKFKKTNIIAISSIAGKKYIKAPIGYSLAKNSLDFLVKILAKNLAVNKININLISPGNLLINNNNWSKKLKKNPEVIKRYIKSNVPLKSFVDSQEIINLIKFLIYNSKNITGSDFVIDGGQVL